METENQILDEKSVKKLTSLSRTTRWRLERAGLFPKRVQLSNNRVGWHLAEVKKWLESREQVQ